MFKYSTLNPHTPFCCPVLKDTYNFYLVIEVPDHVYVFYEYRLYFADKDIYMIRYFYHKIVINRIDIGIGHTRSTKRYNVILY